jgi:hypothetical protein
MEVAFVSCTLSYKLLLRYERVGANGDYGPQLRSACRISEDNGTRDRSSTVYTSHTDIYYTPRLIMIMNILYTVSKLLLQCKIKIHM